jgi:hypothetical protein
MIHSDALSGLYHNELSVLFPGALPRLMCSALSALDDYELKVLWSISSNGAQHNNFGQRPKIKKKNKN